MEKTVPAWLAKRAHLAKHVDYPNHRGSKVFISILQWRNPTNWSFFNRLHVKCLASREKDINWVEKEFMRSEGGAGENERVQRRTQKVTRVQIGIFKRAKGNTWGYKEAYVRVQKRNMERYKKEHLKVQKGTCKGIKKDWHVGVPFVTCRGTKEEHVVGNM